MRIVVLAITSVVIASHPAPATAKVIQVGPGDSIQAAVDLAGSGDTVMVRPGTYHETGKPCPSDASAVCAVVIDKDGISLVGQSSPHNAVIIENPGGQDRGIEVARAGASGATCIGDASERITGSLIEGVTVNGFADDGIFLLCVDDWSIERSSTNDNAEYGIFPSHCGAGRVTMNVATGANDTGIYIGQSHDVRIDHTSRPTTSAASRSRTRRTCAAITIGLLATREGS